MMNRSKDTTPGPGNSKGEGAETARDDAGGVVAARERFQRLGEEVSNRYRRASDDVPRGTERALEEIHRDAERARESYYEDTESTKFLELVKQYPGRIAMMVGLGLAWLLATRRRRRSAPTSAEAMRQAPGARRYEGEQEVTKVSAYLHARGLGIKPEDLPPLLEGALSEMRCVLFPNDPAGDLPVAETAALRRGGFTMKPAPSGPSSALARSVAEHAALRQTSLTVTEAALRLGVDPSRMHQLLDARKLYGLQVQGVWRIPAFQLDGERLLPGLDEILPVLPKDLPPVGVYHWFTEPNPDLTSDEGEHQLSPREWLLAGYPPRAVAELATDLDSL